MNEPLLGDLLVGIVALERLGELVVDRANVRGLLDRGGRLVRHDGTRSMIVFHALWYVALVLERHVLGERMPQRGALATLVSLALVTTAARVWVLGTLGRRWTMRVVVVPGESPIARGPYRLLRHPNSAVVVAEVAVLALLVGAWRTALVGSLAHLPVLLARVRAEDAAWRRRDDDSVPPPSPPSPLGRASEPARRAK